MTGLVLLLLVTAPDVPEGRPVEMTSRGGLEIDLQKQVGIAKGDVVIKRDDVVVCCDEAKAHYDRDRIRRVVCTGRVVIVRPDGTRGSADVAIFDGTREEVTLTGDARVRSDTADLAGEIITYDIRRDRLVVRGKRSRFRLDHQGQQRKEPPRRTCPPEGR